MKIWLTKIWCFLGNHSWTCAVEQGQTEPTQKQIDDGIDGFFDYAKMYCKHCGYVWPGSFRK